MALLSYEMWSWIILDWTSYNLKWRSFNPSIPTSWGGTASIIWWLSSGSSISLYWFQYGHEVLLALWKWDNNTEIHYIEFRKNTTTLFTFEWSSYEIYAYIWIDYDEIMSNWTDYYIDYWYISWWIKNIQWTLNYQITDFPTIVWPVESGKIWVEWDYIRFTDAVLTTTWYKHFIQNDWVIYSTGKTPWMFRIDTTNHWKLCYIDSNWNERKTHQWDNTWSPWNNEPATSWKTPWMIRVSSPEWNYGYISFIWYDGNRYRIMNWNV